MEEPQTLGVTSPISFELRLENSNSKSPVMIRRNHAPSSDSREASESDVGHFARLEALDPQKRERLEARFSTPRGLNQDSQHSNASISSTGSDREVEHTPSQRNEKLPGRKRKAAQENGSPSQTSTKSGRSEAGIKITEYFKNNSPSHRKPQNLLPSFTGQQFPAPDSSSTLPHPMNKAAVQREAASESSDSDEADSGLISVHESIQTDLTMTSLKELETVMSSGKESSQKKDSTIDELKGTVENYKKQLLVQQKAVDKMKKTLEKCIEMNKKLLIAEAELQKRTARDNCMTNRIRLGQFVPVRQGASFVETWSEGYAFKELTRQQEKINQQREELERQKKQLGKKKPSSSNTVGKEKKSSKNSTDSDTFARPASPTLSPSEYHERDEILKLRITGLKKEETDLQMELEKLDRDRNLHIRELKRIHNEDNSRFKGNPVLNKRYLLLYLLGKGGFSEVHKGYDLLEHRYVACKIHQLNKEWKEDKKANYIKHALREYNIHRSLSHERIVRLFDVFEIDTNSFCTVLEYCDGNDLDFLLKQHKTVPEREAKSIVMQTVSALKYLNQIKPPVIHYDLKPGNILLVGTGALSGEVKITDFGLSKVMDDCSDESGMDLTSQGAGTYWYLPPECFVVGKDPPKISSKVDVWSVGVIFYQVLYGKRPFGHNHTQAAILEQNIILKAKEVEFPPKPAVSAEAKNFIRRCLAYKKEDRVDVLTLCEDPYLKPPSSKKSSTSGNTQHS